ncbi:hypothetical protein MAR_009439 [Mya arenaria]|uniref:Uncharacterized protein n=1 Tax=Mya arenaria TaxID=6604 RepID=A0ABY7E2Z0_MYAAR|nr:hypothetical protein MAR_009439 [Mya arenaria]
MTQTNIIYSTHGEVTDMNVTLSDSNFRVLVEQQSTGQVWFTTTFGSLSYSGMPRIFVARRKNVPFLPPVVLDGNLGCWLRIDLVNCNLWLTDTTNMSPAKCTDTCWNISEIALIVTQSRCYCADIDIYPADHPTMCGKNCPNTVEPCGGVTSDYGNAYHIQGPKLPGQLDIVDLYSQRFLTPINVISVDEVDIVPNVGPHFINCVSVEDEISSNVTFTFQYSNMACALASPTDSHALEQPTFYADGSVYTLPLIKMGCITISLSSAVSDVLVTLGGPEDADYIELPVVVLSGSRYIDNINIDYIYNNYNFDDNRK